MAVDFYEQSVCFLPVRMEYISSMLFAGSRFAGQKEREGFGIGVQYCLSKGSDGRVFADQSS